MKPRLLVWSPGGMPILSQLEATIAKAVELRGAEVLVIQCDGALSGCMLRELPIKKEISEWKKDCSNCSSKCLQAAQIHNLNIKGIGEFIPTHRLNELKEIAKTIPYNEVEHLIHQNIPIGSSILSAYTRYFMGFSIDKHPEIIPEYIFSGLVVAEAIQEVVQQFKPTHAFMSHAMYADWGPAFKYLIQQNITTTLYMGSYLKGHFLFNKVKGRFPDFQDLSDAVWNQLFEEPWGPIQENRLNQFFENRYVKGLSHDMAKHFNKLKPNPVLFKESLNLDPTKKTWALFTHMNWDSVSEMAPMVHSDFDAWVLDTLKIISQLTDVQWLIKIHPCEYETNPDSGALKLIEKYFPKLPSHIKIIAPDAPILPWDFYQLIDGGVTCFGTAGLELGSLGKPVILAGKSYYSGKGTTYDANDRNEYRALLSSAHLIPSLSPELHLKAKKIAYIHFIQRPIPINATTYSDKSYPIFRAEKAHLIEPHQDPFMDLICQNILEGNEFFIPEELLQLKEEFKPKILISDYLNLIEKNILEHNLSLATQTINEALTLYPNQSLLYNNKALCSVLQGDIELAYKDIRKAHLLDPSSKLILENLKEITTQIFQKQMNEFTNQLTQL